MGLPASSYQKLIFDNHLQNLGQQGWREPKSGTCGPLWHEAHGWGRCWGGQTRGVLTSLTLVSLVFWIYLAKLLDLSWTGEGVRGEGGHCETRRNCHSRLWPCSRQQSEQARLSFSCCCHNCCLLLLLSQPLFLLLWPPPSPRSMFQGGCSRPGLLGSSWHFWMSSSRSSCGSGEFWCLCLKRIHKNELPAIWQYFASCLHVDYLKSQSHI